MKNLLSTQSTSVETAQTKRRLTWRNVFTRCALFGALTLPLKTSAQEQISPESKKVESTTPTSTQKQDSSTILYDEAKQMLNGEKREISTEEIQEYIQNNREEFEEYIKNNGEELNKIIDKQTMDILREQLANDEDIKSMINKMVNRDDIRDAVKKGNTQYIQEQIKEELSYINKNVLEETLAGLAMGIVFTEILRVVISRIASIQTKKEMGKVE